MTIDDTAPAPRALVCKLAEVMAAVARIPKHGHNDFHNYDYATEADIVAAIRLELAQRHVMLLPAITAMDRVAVGEKGSVLTSLTMAFTFYDGDSGETLTRPWLGAGTDKEDKGAYKAMTGGEKYFLLKTFLIPTGDDPEAEAKEPRPVAVARPAAPLAAPAAAPPAGTFTRVKSIDVKTGNSAKGPWTLYIVKFADGREGSTFDSNLALVAEQCKAKDTPIEPVLEPGRKAGTWALTELAIVRESVAVGS
jgi:hypothetical protein